MIAEASGSALGTTLAHSDAQYIAVGVGIASGSSSVGSFSRALPSTRFVDEWEVEAVVFIIRSCSKNGRLGSIDPPATTSTSAT